MGLITIHSIKDGAKDIGKHVDMIVRHGGEEKRTKSIQTWPINII
jgi:hypothetical protein